ncbi:hypothetical protein WA158_002411 [Blastocystis sp. Blastoise]
MTTIPSEDIVIPYVQKISRDEDGVREWIDTLPYHSQVAIKKLMRYNKDIRKLTPDENTDRYNGIINNIDERKRLGLYKPLYDQPRTPGRIARSEEQSYPRFFYRAHSANIGWTDWYELPDAIGTTEKGLRMEAFEVCGPNEFDFFASVHVQNYGWTNWEWPFDIYGTTGNGLQIEAVKVILEKVKFHIQYRVYIQDYGWTEWVRDGAPIGSNGQGKAVEAIQMDFY